MLSGNINACSRCSQVVLESSVRFETTLSLELRQAPFLKRFDHASTRTRYLCPTRKGSSRRTSEDETPQEPREPKLGIDVRLVIICLPPPNSAEPSKPRRIYVRNSVELARYGYTLGCRGCEAAVSAIPGFSRDHSGTVLSAKLSKATFADAALSERSRRAHERMKENWTSSDLDTTPVMCASSSSSPPQASPIFSSCTN